MKRSVATAHWVCMQYNLLPLSTMAWRRGAQTKHSPPLSTDSEPAIVTFYIARKQYLIFDKQYIRRHTNTAINHTLHVHSSTQPISHSPESSNSFENWDSNMCFSHIIAITYGKYWYLHIRAMWHGAVIWFWRLFLLPGINIIESEHFWIRIFRSEDCRSRTIVCVFDSLCGTCEMIWLGFITLKAP